jgi:signal transduction histidine kinase
MSSQSNILAKASLRILHLEDNADDRKLVERALARDGLHCNFLAAANRSEFESALNHDEFDLIISDFTVPAYDGEAALAASRERRPGTPFILVSGTIGEERAIEFLKAGVADCVLKDNLPRLGPAVRRALREAEERKGRMKAEDAIRERTIQLRALAARLQTSREEERLRISREIHDEFGAVLTAQKFGLEWIKQRLGKSNQATSLEPIFEKLDSLKTLADTTAKRVRELCTELRPPILDDMGLVATIEWQAREFQTRTNIRCEVTSQPEALNLTNEQATAIFRIFQEILTNVARHSNASSVRVQLKIAGDRFILEVKDNGKGISADKIGGGGSFGLLGMRERALILGGEIHIDGAARKGTTVMLSVPIDLPKIEETKQV